MRALLFFTHRRIAGFVARRTVVITVVVVPHPIDAFDDIMLVTSRVTE
jgi:hypothetical protein